MEKKMAESSFWVNQLIELHTRNGEVYSSQIIGFEENSILVQQPVDSKNHALEISKGMPVTIYFYDELRGQCKFESEVAFHPLQFAIKKPAAEQVAKVERRSFFRVPANVKIYLDRNVMAQLEPSILFTQDISGGGFSFLYPHQMERGVILSGSLHLKVAAFQKKVNFEGEVVFVKKNINKAYLISVEFIGMSELVRSDVIKYCMYRQIELRNKLKSY